MPLLQYGSVTSATVTVNTFHIAADAAVSNQSLPNSPLLVPLQSSFVFVKEKKSKDEISLNINRPKPCRRSRGRFIKQNESEGDNRRRTRTTATPKQVRNIIWRYNVINDFLLSYKIKEKSALKRGEETRSKTPLVFTSYSSPSWSSFHERKYVGGRSYFSFL